MPDDFAVGGYKYEAYRQVYALHKKYPRVTDDSQWPLFVDDLAKLEGEYAQAMGVLVATELERKYKEDRRIAGRLKNDNTPIKNEQIMLNI